MEIASFILDSYSFIKDMPFEKLLGVGNQSKNGQPIPSFDEKVLFDLCSEVLKIFEKEENVLEIEGDVIIVGDIHGSLHDLLRIIKFWQESEFKILFLGDYVDRGNFSLECITLLFAFKIMHPDIFYLIRGNHEFNSLCTQYGFKDEILNYHNLQNSTHLINKKKKRKIPKFCKIGTFSEDSENSKNDSQSFQYTEMLYNAFINVFSFLPISAIVNKKTFCIHGGLSPKLNSINDLNTLIKRPIHLFKESPLLADVLWSDPQENLNLLFDENSIRGQGFSYNENAVDNFLNNTSLSRIIRAHQCVKRGVLKNFNNKCITVFSASSYDKNIGNSSSILQLFQKDDKLKVTTFLPIKRNQKSEIVYNKVHYKKFS